MTTGISIGSPIHPDLMTPVGPRATPADPPTPPNTVAEALPPVHLKFSGEMLREAQQIHDGLRVLCALA
jgi:hypothetical protein